MILLANNDNDDDDDDDNNNDDDENNASISSAIHFIAQNNLSSYQLMAVSTNVSLFSWRKSAITINRLWRLMVIVIDRHHCKAADTITKLQ